MDMSHAIQNTLICIFIVIDVSISIQYNQLQLTNNITFTVNKNKWNFFYN